MKRTLLLLTALLLAPLATLMIFQSVENWGALISNNWN